MAQPILKVNNLSKRFCRNPELGFRYANQDIANELASKKSSDHLRPGEFWALRNANFKLDPGQVVGMIGHNGAGKSTLINLITGVLRPTTGSIEISTHKVAMISHQGGLDSGQTGRENVYNQLSLNGMPKRVINESAASIIDFSEIAHSIDAPVGSYSLGMRQRLLFAIYAHLSPDLFIVDEALNGGDLAFRRKFQMFLNDFIAKGGSILLASHDLFAIQTMCNQCILLSQGEIISIGEPVEVIDSYQKSLIGSDAGSQPISESNDNSLFTELGAKAPLADTADVVVFESVEMFVGDGLTPGGSATVRIACRSRETISPAACTIIIHDNSAQRLAMITTFQPTLAEGRHVFNCLLENLSLVPATYYLMAVVTNVNNGVVLGTKGFFDKPVPFEVIGPLDALNNLNRFYRSFLHVPASWSSELVK